MSRPKKISASQRAHLESRLAEGLENWQAQRKPKRKPNLVSYDWAKRRVVNAERAAHRKCYGLTGDTARDNFDHIFRRNA